MRRRLRLVALWTVSWTLYEWWAVIGWPDTPEASHAALVLSTLGSGAGLTVWYGIQRAWLPRPPTRPPDDP